MGKWFSIPCSGFRKRPERREGRWKAAFRKRESLKTDANWRQQAVDHEDYRLALEEGGAGGAADTRASVRAGQAAEAAEARLRALAAAEGLYLTGRYWPGYGDWPIGVQPRIAALLDTPRRIGLCVTDTCLMLPRKSVTAALGVGREPVTGYRAGCAHCQLRDKCEYRKRGETCES